MLLLIFGVGRMTGTGCDGVTLDRHYNERGMNEHVRSTTGVGV